MLPDAADRRAMLLSSGLMLIPACGISAGVSLAFDAAWPLAAGIALAAAALVLWLNSRRYRRRRRAVTRPTPPSWHEVLERDVAFYQRLDADERQRFEALMKVFRAEIPVVGIACELDEQQRILIAAGAVIPIFGFPRWEYESLQKVLVYPESFQSPFELHPHTGPQAHGLVTDTEGLNNGLMILSQPEIVAGFAAAEDRHNVVIHEFAHLVDQANGRIDGYPAGLPAADRDRWQELVKQQIHRGLRGETPDIDAYAFTNEEEFFAVCSEYFFEDPSELERQHPELYGMLRSIYRQDTSDRFRSRLLRRRSGRHPEA